MAFTPPVANNITIYIKSTARTTLRYIITLARVNDALALALRAQKFPEATSFKI
jgi:hypothetical protein